VKTAISGSGAPFILPIESSAIARLNSTREQIMSVQRSGLFHVPRLATLVIVTQRLPAIDNEIWSEKIHFDFSPRDIFLKAELP